MHYHSETEAKEKWERRAQRINWDNLKIKFSMDKDYANEQLLADFEALPFKNKLSVSKEKYEGAKSNIQVPGFAFDATTTFRNSLKVINLIGWLKRGNSFH